jgi:hypothetical protein
MLVSLVALAKLEKREVEKLHFPPPGTSSLTFRENIPELAALLIANNNDSSMACRLVKCSQRK